MWWNGPELLDDPGKWPDAPTTQPSTEIETEAKVIRKVLCAAQVQRASDDLDQLLERHDLHRTLKPGFHLSQFIGNHRRCIVCGHWRRKFIRKDKAFYSPVTTDNRHRR